MATANNPNSKDTIYIDIDDEITSIIDKVRSSNDKIVALVLPKRATVLQSIVNMKLLKRSADNEQKNLVLITAEAGLLPLAGTVGLYVAKTLQSKPEIPTVYPITNVTDDAAEAANLDEVEEITAQSAGERAVGELAGAATPAAVAATAAYDPVETLELDDEPLASAAAATADSKLPASSDTKTNGKDKPKKPKKNRKLAVPNFERFRLLLILGVVLLIVLIVSGVVAAKVLPKASITVVTDTVDVNSSLSFTADKNAKTVDADNRVLPAQLQQTSKSQTQQVPTTGKKNNGTKASGTVTMSAGSCIDTVPSDIPAGIPLTNNGLTYILSESVSFTPTVSRGKCTFQGVNNKGDNAINIAAQQSGASYNVDGNFAVYARSNISATGSTDGGTDEIVQTVAQSDIDNATQKLAAQDSNTIRSQLEQQLKTAGFYPLESTFVAAAPTTTNSSNVGDQATTLTVTQAINYTMYGVKQADLKTLVDNDVKRQIDPAKQSILSEGLDKANFKVNTTTASSVQIALTTTATAGPDLSADDIKKSSAGKKEGQVKDQLKTEPGVSDVQVKLSPFWVTSVPGNADKVTVTFQKAN